MTEKPKIVNISDKKAYTPPEEVPELELNSGDPDPFTIQAIEELLEAAKSGKVTGIVALTWCMNEEGFWRHITFPVIPNMKQRNIAALMLGGLKMLESDLEDMAFWTEGYDPLVYHPKSDESENEDTDSV
jgi:hypothetical protein